MKCAVIQCALDCRKGRVLKTLGEKKSFKKLFEKTGVFVVDTVEGGTLDEVNNRIVNQR